MCNIFLSALDINFPFLDPLVEDSEIASAFEKFVLEYKKEYSNEEDIASRKKTFAANYRKIVELNNRPSKSFTLAINKFADFS